MASGYVYILINHSLPNMLKIGRTARDSRARARELSNTSIPTPYIVAYEVFTEDCEGVEKEMHAMLADFRVTGNREFFNYPLDKSIQLLLEMSAPVKKETNYAAIDILDELIAKYNTDLDKDIVSIRIVQAEERVWLEVTREKEVAGHLKDQYIRRTDLGFIEEAYNQSFFSPSNTVVENARRFVEDYDPFSIIMTTDIFHKDACRRIDKEFNPIYKDEGKSNSSGTKC